jgi:hypothetical protein
MAKNAARNANIFIMSYILFLLTTGAAESTDSANDTTITSGKVPEVMFSLPEPGYRASFM